MKLTLPPVIANRALTRWTRFFYSDRRVAIAPRDDEGKASFTVVCSRVDDFTIFIQIRPAYFNKPFDHPKLFRVGILAHVVEPRT